MSKLYALILLGVKSGVNTYKLRLKIKYLTLLSEASRGMVMTIGVWLDLTGY